MGKVLQLKLAKASDEDIKCVTDFLNMLDEIMEYGTFMPPNDDEEEYSEEIGPERLMELIEAAWGGSGRSGVGSSWRRVIWGCDTLIRNCCDPDVDVLEWRPDVRAWLESQQKGE